MLLIAAQLFACVYAHTYECRLQAKQKPGACTDCQFAACRICGLETGKHAWQPAVEARTTVKGDKGTCEDAHAQPCMRGW